MQEIIEILKNVTEAILTFLKEFSLAFFKDKFKIVVLFLAIIAFFVILISAALN